MGTMQESCHSLGTLPSLQHTLNNLTNQSINSLGPSFIISPYVPSILADFPFFTFLIATSTSSLLIFLSSSLLTTFPIIFYPSTITNLYPFIQQFIKIHFPSFSNIILSL